MGGTIFKLTNGIRSETAWPFSGGGYSIYYDKPVYQYFINNIQTKRGVPDIAGSADMVLGLYILLNGEYKIAGGTSVVAPFYAALHGIINNILNKNIGFINPILYLNKDNIFTDIISGKNLDYSAATGWDPITGLGVIKPNNLIQIANANNIIYDQQTRLSYYTNNKKYIYIILISIFIFFGIIAFVLCFKTNSNKSLVYKITDSIFAFCLNILYILYYILKKYKKNKNKNTNTNTNKYKYKYSNNDYYYY